VLTTLLLEQLAPRLGAYLTVQHDRKRGKVSELRKFAERHGWRWEVVARRGCEEGELAEFLEATAAVRTGHGRGDHETVHLTRIFNT